ncbi:hypothetical protein ES708_31329 [subsurface metagenome]
MLKSVKVEAFIRELRGRTEDKSVANVMERKQVLTEIIRGRFVDFMTHLTPEKLRSAALQEIRITEYGKDIPVKTTTIKLNSIIQATDLLNKMERLYEADGSMHIDNRTLIINVMSEKSRSLTERLMGAAHLIRFIRAKELDNPLAE